MTFHKIDMQAWERKKRYEHYAEAVPCTYSMTVALDVTKLLCGVREKGLPFFPVVLYGLAREVNRHAEFRMAQDEMGNVGYYSHCDPCYTVFHKETESFTEVWTAYDASPAVFLAAVPGGYGAVPECSGAFKAARRQKPVQRVLHSLVELYRLQPEFAERI